MVQNKFTKKNRIIVRKKYEKRFVKMYYKYNQIIPSCSDLVTLCIDIWTSGEEADCVKLAFATDIATKHLVLTDIQPPPLCRYMKVGSTLFSVLLLNQIKLM